MRVASAVVDASTTAAWLLPDEASDASRAVYARMRRGSLQLQAPELWLWECGNIIASAVKRRRLSADDAFLTWSVLDVVRSRVELTVPKPAQVRAALAVAIDHRLSIYDAAYLWLAASLGIPLLSADHRLDEAAAAHAVPLLALTDIA